MNIEIAVPTYNCASWLDALFQSIVGQDFSDWRIVARDDASTDNTSSVLATWQLRLGKRLLILEDSAGNLGMNGNYNAVLSATKASMVMLADPDDVWLPGKISATLNAMRSAEQASSKSTPIVVCSDARVVDDDLRMIAPSYWGWSGHRPELLSVFRRMIVESPALSSTMMVNRELLDLALPMTDAACPDWWLALVACSLGRIVHLPETTILYRRHSTNDSIPPMTSTLRAAAGRVGQAHRRVDRLIHQYARQAGAFLMHFEDKLLPSDVSALRTAERLPLLGMLGRRWAVVRYGLWFGSPLKNIGLMMLL